MKAIDSIFTDSIVHVKSLSENFDQSNQSLFFVGPLYLFLKLATLTLTLIYVRDFSVETDSYISTFLINLIMPGHNLSHLTVCRRCMIVLPAINSQGQVKLVSAIISLNLLAFYHGCRSLIG